MPTKQVPFNVGMKGIGSELWFAELRAKRAGDFGLSYSVERPAAVDKNGFTIESVTYRFKAVVRIHAQDSRHSQILTTDGSLLTPQVNVGDVVVLPVWLDPRLVDHKFQLLGRDDREIDSYFSVFWEPREEIGIDSQVFKVESAGESPIRIVQAGDLNMGRNVPGTKEGHQITARLEFANVCDFNLSSQLAGINAKPTSYSFHVVAKGQPIRLFLGYILCTEMRGGNRPSKSSGASAVAWGAVEARVGDQITLNCGSYSVPSQEKNPSKRTVVIKIEPFKVDRIY